MIVAGVDEAGRGSLVGPVVAAAVIMEEQFLLSYKEIKDSKCLSPLQRERAFRYICDKAVSVSVGVVSHKFIDRFNILNASLEAMKKAVFGLHVKPDLLLVDGTHKVPISVPQRCIKKGDKVNKLISAASIVAKVYRDRIMLAYHNSYPVYNLAKNKGYPTKEHLDVLKRFGPSPIHRLSYKSVRIYAG
jgi:ribonuclease HII